MHLMLASVSAATSPTGVCRHAANIARGMLAFSSVQKVTMFTGAWQADYFRDAFDLKSKRLEIKSVAIPNRSLSRNLWYLRGIPAEARASGADIVHLAYPMPILRSTYSTPVVVSLHDLYPFDMSHNFGRRAWLNRTALKLCLRNADAIACVSEKTRVRANELFPATISQKTTLVPNSVFLSHVCDTTPLPSAIGEHPFLLCVAQHRPNKNLTLLVRSFRTALDRNILSPATRLVLVGIEGPETHHLQQMVAQYHLEDQVLFLRGLSDSLLSTLYARCELVIAPSLLEGFGLPVAEALSIGSRVVCSDIPAFRAIDATHSTFFNPTDISGESLLAALQHAIRTPRGIKTATAGLHPQHAAAKYLAIYSSLLRHKETNALQRVTS